MHYVQCVLSEKFKLICHTMIHTFGFFGLVLFVPDEQDDGNDEADHGQGAEDTSGDDAGHVRACRAAGLGRRRADPRQEAGQRQQHCPGSSPHPHLSGWDGEGHKILKQMVKFPLRPHLAVNVCVAVSF